MKKMTPFDEKTVKLSNGEELFYRKRKGGTDTLVLLHGNMNSSQNWDVLMNEISTDLTIYALDLRGFGDSTYHKPIESIKDFSDDLKDFADKLKLKNFHLSGWSLGGNVAMQFAIDHPDYVDKLVLLSSGPITGYPTPKKRFFGLFKTNEYLKTKEEIEKSVKMIETIREKKRRRLLRLILNKSLYTHSKPNMARLVKYEGAFMKQRNLADVNYALAYFNIAHEHNGVTDGDGSVDNIKAETLIVHGEGDKIVPLKHAEKIKEALGDKAELKTYSDAGHAVPIDKTKKLAELYFDFLVGT